MFDVGSPDNFLLAFRRLTDVTDDRVLGIYAK